MRRWTRGASPAASALTLLVILFSIGLLGTRVFTRLDLTEKREYTLSRATRNVLARLDDVVNVNVYFSRELPPYFATLDRQVKDLLDEYRAHGGDRLRVEFVDPAADPALETSMQRMGIPKLQLSRYQKERTEVMSAYLGIAVQFEDKTEVIPVVESVEKLEYDLTAALVKVSTERQTVGIAAASSSTVPEELRQLEGLLRQQYLPQAVNLSEGPVPAGIRTLVVRDEDALSDEALYRIDQYLMSGGRLLILAGGVDVNLTNLFARNREVRLGSQLKTYGVEVQSALVVDAQSPMVGFDVGSFLPLAVRYPWFPQVVAEGLAKTNPITSDLQSLVLPWTSPLVLAAVDSSFGASVRAEVLARSSPRSFAAHEPYDLNPQMPLSLPTSGVSPQVLVVALTGKFPSNWRGKPVPGDSTGTAPRGPEVSPETQIVVAGGASFLDGRFLQQFQTNSVFAANAVDWMSMGNDLIAIRSRGQASRPLKEIEGDRKVVLKGLAVFPVPILVVLLGLVRAQLRKARRSRYAIEFGVKP
jgi:gliding-associated putative ABC transporter substrate-binding component GldG